MITKTRAKDEFMLAEKHINTLKSIKVEKTFSENLRSGNLILFLLSQVEDKSIKIHGSYRNLAIAKLNRNKERLKRKRNISSGTGSSNSVKKLKPVKKTSQKQMLEQLGTTLHQHTYEILNGSKKCTTCDFEVQFEII